MTDTTNTQDSTASTAASGPNLNIADLVNVLQVISTCSSRGAFQAAELSSVGGLYDRLHTFLVATGALNQSETPQSVQQAESAAQAA